MTLTADRLAAVRPALDAVRRLWWLCAAVSLIALGAAAVLAIVDPAEVNWVVWLRGSVVAAASLVFVLVTRTAARGSRRAFTRMRWISILAPIGIGLIIVSPDSGYPIWMKIEQGLIGILIVAIAVLLNRRSTRTAFPKAS
ncbi:hypothetical protein LXM50_14940 [Microbacterium sp. Au-Mic1]|uniref:hypothetical protein n=1 Tax=Microbacterium sp. Au-Mic1 TaxID=2906457 RepID=UPI001E2E684A|nr:hypothetical protein [Microbacterium sp. Au-Mic1]MCE4027268.1 hypothetical protein [Microbacterium sp. Au-Mic1]